jgi:hypothetical protein
MHISHHKHKVLAAVTIASIALTGDVARDQALPAMHPVGTTANRVARVKAPEAERAVLLRGGPRHRGGELWVVPDETVGGGTCSLGT